jgi:hypothetical protein
VRSVPDVEQRAAPERTAAHGQPAARTSGHVSALTP